jgi:hypothetical protein
LFKFFHAINRILIQKVLLRIIYGFEAFSRIFLYSLITRFLGEDVVNSLKLEANGFFAKEGILKSIGEVFGIN